MLKKFIYFLFIVVFCILLFPSAVFSQKNNSYISVINLIRSKELGHEKDDLLQSLKDQYTVTKSQNINATWLLQYSVLEDSEMMSYAKTNMSNQEFGLLFEIDRNFTQKANVVYRGQGPQYFSDGLLLVSYDLEERKKLINTAFEKFKGTFGYYPKTVGAWWIGGGSISYMQKKYGITAALRASDQFNLDFYSIWGSPWSIPYLASKENQGIPAESFENSSKVVNLQWAARDPLRGYSDATFSIQDHFLHGYDMSYVEYLSSIYLAKPLGNIVIGLENGGTLEIFEGFYKNMLTFAKNLEKNGKVNIIVAKDYAEKFLENKAVFSDNDHFLYKDFDSDNQSFWYHSPNFRINIVQEQDKIYLNDFKDYSQKLGEDFNYLPNSQPRLKIYQNSVIDSMYFPQSKILLSEKTGVLSVKDEKGNINLYSGDKEIAKFSNDSVYFSGNNQNSENFKEENENINLFLIILSLYLFYIAVVYYFNKNIKNTFIYGFFLFIPLFTAYSYLGKGLENDITFIFDKKEILLFYFLPFPYSFSIERSILILQSVPFISLILFHFAFIVKKPEKNNKVFFIIPALFITLMYSHFPYFPLDNITFKMVLVFFVASSGFLFTTFALIYLKNKTKKTFIVLFFTFIFILISAGITVLFSRSKLVITPFEVSALQFVQNSGKNVLYIEQKDYGLGPIYKSEKPLLYENLSFGEKITRVKWNSAFRPKNHILNISNYQDKLIYIPRYLGTDISEYEIDKLNLTKVFDNAQIAIFESKKSE